MQLFNCTGGETRTPDTRFWRPVLYQLSYTRKHSERVPSRHGSGRDPSLHTNSYDRINLEF